MRVLATLVALSAGLTSPALAAGDDGLSRFSDIISLDLTSYLTWPNVLSALVVGALVLAIVVGILNAMQLVVQRALRRAASITRGLENLEQGLLISDADN